MSAAIGQIIATPASIDAGFLLGGVEESEGQFELIQIDGGFRWSIHDSLHNALRHMVTSGRESRQCN